MSRHRSLHQIHHDLAHQLTTYLLVKPGQEAKARAGLGKRQMYLQHMPRQAKILTQRRVEQENPQHQKREDGGMPMDWLMRIAIPHSIILHLQMVPVLEKRKEENDQGLRKK
jgi:hypothetical protein